MLKSKNKRNAMAKSLINLQNNNANNHVGGGEGPVRQNSRGITLIALIITIIVMLILVAVTINVALDTGLFGIARKAGDKTKVEADRETLQGAVVASVNEDLQIPNEATLQQNLPEGWSVTGADGGPYIATSPNGNKFTVDNKGKITIEGEEVGTTDVHNWERNLDDITCTKCGAHYTIGQEINYTPNAKTEATIEGDKSGLTKARAINYEATDGTEDLVGDGFPDVNVAEKYSSDTQTISKEDLEWVVLGIEDTDNNGSNETLLITSKTATTNGVFAYGAEAYEYMPDELNRICKELYSNPEYGEARSMNTKDVENCLGYKQTKGYIRYNNEDIIIDNLETKFNGLNNVKAGLWDSIKAELEAKEKIYTPDGINTIERLGEYRISASIYYINKVNNDIYILNPSISENPSVEHNITEKALKVINSGMPGAKYTCYWLATSDAYFDNNSDNSTIFYMLQIGYGVSEYYEESMQTLVGQYYANYPVRTFYDSNGGKNGIINPIRPVVELKGNIPQ